MMRKGCFLLLLILSGPGCLSPGSHVEAESRRSPQVRMALAPAPPMTPAPAPVPQIVTADQVYETNAPEIVQALSKEMDYETNSGRMPPAMATTMANPTRP